MGEPEDRMRSHASSAERDCARREGEDSKVSANKMPGCVMFNGKKDCDLVNKEKSLSCFVATKISFYFEKTKKKGIFEHFFDTGYYKNIKE